MLGKINWYDVASGKGSIIGDNGIWYRINEFTRLGLQTPSEIFPGQRVVFSLANTSVHPIVIAINIVEAF